VRLRMETLYDIVPPLMLALREKPATPADLAGRLALRRAEVENLLSLLEETECVRRKDEAYLLAIPVFGRQDFPMVRDALKLSRSILLPWMEQNLARIEQALRETSPLRAKVPFPQMYWTVWHYLFGITNRILVEEGFFYDPYGPARTYKGFLPCVWDPSVQRWDE
ncbi:MAG: hypothetical protein AAB225_19180, partial [Acidobacteriota bacterium]